MKVKNRISRGLYAFPTAMMNDNTPKKTPYITLELRLPLAEEPHHFASAMLTGHPKRNLGIYRAERLHRGWLSLEHCEAVISPKAHPSYTALAFVAHAAAKILRLQHCVPLWLLSWLQRRMPNQIAYQTG